MNINVTRIDRSSNGMIQFYNQSDVVDSFSITSSVSVGFENNLAKTIVFSNSVKTLSFNVFNLTTLYGATSSKIFSSGIAPSDTSSAYINRLYDIYGFLISDMVQGCCPGPTFVGGVVASYLNYASFPATGQHSVIYIDEGTNQAYFWDGTSYQLLIAKNVEQYVDFASFPVTGLANVIYIDMSVPEPYVWDGTAYISLTDSATVAWGSIIGTLSDQTDLQSELDSKVPTTRTISTTAPLSGGGDLSANRTLSMPKATTLVDGYLSATDWATFNGKQAALVSGTNIKTVNSTTLLGSGNIAVEPTITAGTTAQYYRGDKTFQTLDKTAVGLGNVDNTSDANKPISTATQTALNAKQDSLGFTPVPTTRTLTINGTTQDLSADRTFTIATNPGTVTSVAALTLGTTGTDLSSTVANGTTTPVITLNVPTASATNRGALSSADWSTFNGKQAALVSGTNIKTVNSTTLLGSGDIAVQATLVSGTNIKTINSTSLLGSGNITVGTFTLPSLTSGSVLFSDGTTIAQNNANFFWDNTNGRLGIGTASPATPLHVLGNVTIGNPASLWRINFDVTSGSNPGGYLNWTFSDNFTYYRQYNQSAFHNYETTSASGYGHRFISQGTVSLTIRSTGNVLIGTTTDAGYKLDVNGISRVNGSLVLGTYGLGTGVFWNNSTNNLGIGNTSPSQKLDILGTNVVATKIKSSTNTGASAYQAFNDLDNSYEFGMWGSTRGGYGAIASGNAYLYGSIDLAVTSLSNIKFGAGATPIERLRIKSTGQVRYFPLASAPTGAEKGDVYFDSTLNKLRVYNGTEWETITSI